jgi:hypothetical protein
MPTAVGREKHQPESLIQITGSVLERRRSQRVEYGTTGVASRLIDLGSPQSMHEVNPADAVYELLDQRLAPLSSRHARKLMEDK